MTYNVFSGALNSTIPSLLRHCCASDAYSCIRAGGYFLSAAEYHITLLTCPVLLSKVESNLRPYRRGFDHYIIMCWEGQKSCVSSCIVACSFLCFCYHRWPHMSAGSCRVGLTNVLAQWCKMNLNKTLVLLDLDVFVLDDGLSSLQIWVAIQCLELQYLALAF